MSLTYTEGYGPTVSAVRELLGLSRTELADLLGVSMDSVRSWEVGRRPVPAHVADELAALGIPVVVDAPGVGRNLHDHLLVPFVFETTTRSIPERQINEAVAQIH